uniref:toll-like receptor 22 n=1 Tax=Scatophagus argus TaxID=75038 RepID=UPI001ED86322|nr:toll-like receptor 22 [Scatophagus argus]
MSPEVRKDKGSKYFKLIIIFLFLNVRNFVPSVTGFALRNCRISNNKAICAKNEPKLKVVPRDIPSTVKSIDLSGNKISTIEMSDFKNLPLVIQLDLNYNNISRINPGSFADLISLSRLNLNSNKLVKLGDGIFEGLSNLTVLRISSNLITLVESTTFKSLSGLKLLDISYNKLHRLTIVHSILQQLPNLQDLSLKHNNLITFQSWELTNSSLELTSLDLSQNPIAIFGMTADVFPSLTWFNIGGTLGKQNMKWDVHNKTYLSQVSTLDISGLHVDLTDMKRLLESVNASLAFLRMNGMKQNPPALINISCTIPTMSKLQLRHNRLKFVRSDLFQLCINVTEIDLADNKIRRIDEGSFKSVQGLSILTLCRNRLPSVPAATRNLPTLVELDLSSNNISTLECNDFANMSKLRQLNLYGNSISALKQCVFKDLMHLQVLKLQNNIISKLDSAFKKYLPNLKQLRLNGNKLVAIKQGDFKGLRSLQNLSLHENQIQQLENGSFSGLTNLTDIQLQSNKIQRSGIENGVLNDLINLRRLDIRNNNIRYDNSLALSNPPFSQLSHLETLAMPSQHHRGKSHLPCNILQGLTNLLVFNTRNIQLLSLPKDMFNYTPRLQTLDISSNDLLDLSPDLFSPIQSLKSLYISRTSLQSLNFLINANLTKLEFMQARKNEYSVISEDIMKSLPALGYVDLQGNSFTCDCDNAWLIQWIRNNTQTQVFDAYNFQCNYPPDLNQMKLLDFDIQSCSVSTDFICFISTTCMILLFMVVSFTYHFLRWQLAYAYYFFLALLFDTKNKNRQIPHQYDAFVSYNTHDEPWVMRELLPKLEGEQGWRLCLHHRDFQPGKPIIDNITDAIYGSRKTICVISHRYLESEWCSREIQVASFRLFDEQKDVLILVFLEEIPTSQLSPYYRMRKLLKSQTYLSWLQAEKNPSLFWEKLRQALRSKEDFCEDRLLLTEVDRG